MSSQVIGQPDPKRWKVLDLLGFANFIVMMDSAVIQVALCQNTSKNDTERATCCTRKSPN